MSAADFDFLIGHWIVRNERLKHRFAGSAEWAVFQATANCRKVLGGAGNMDEMAVDGSDFIGLSLRVFDPATDLWSIHWVDNDRHRLLPPMTGRFEGGIGTFYGDEEHEDSTVLARFTWTPTPGAPRWEQAFSDDGGNSWETNWVMTFSPAA